MVTFAFKLVVCHKSRIVPGLESIQQLHYMDWTPHRSILSFRMPHILSFMAPSASAAGF